MTVPRFIHSRTGGWLAALGFVVAWYAVLQGVAYLALAVAPNLDAMPLDLAVHLGLGAVLYAMSRSLRWYLPAVGLLLAALHLSNAGKIAVLGGPIMPDDVLAVRNLFLLLQGWQLAGVVAIVAVPLSLLLLMIAWRSLRAWVMVSVSAVAVAGFALAPGAVVAALDATFGTSVWNQRGNYEARGLLLHLTQEGARYLVRAGSPPPDAQVAAALTQLAPLPGAAPAVQAVAVAVSNPRPRNVHVILLESFWDVARLSAAGLSSDPVDPRFRALWRETGHSQAMSPVFGGYTANAEFEVLCGFPVTEDAVFFEGWLRRDVPCLPRHLAAAGYHSIASHPNIAAFWNRVNAYDRIGFDSYWSDQDFVLDDMNREFLSDASLYRQVLQKIGRTVAAETPVFNYIVTFFGHLDYPLNAQRPKRIETGGDNALVNGYANIIYYKSRELMDFLDELRRIDPGSLIVLFGDHLPFLGPNFAGFTDSGVLADNRSKFDAPMVYRFVTTPLVVIDGQRGPLRLGDVPMYRFPGLILDLLGDYRPTVMRLLDGGPDQVMRPLPGMHLVVQGGQQLLCRQDQPPGGPCMASQTWLDAVVTVTQDLFGGDQHTLRHAAAAVGGKAPARVAAAPTIAGG